MSCVGTRAPSSEDIVDEFKGRESALLHIVYTNPQAVSLELDEKRIDRISMGVSLLKKYGKPADLPP